MVDDLSVSCRIQTPSGWLEVEDEANGYTLHSDTRGTRSVTRRTKEVKGEWVAGAFAQRSVPENVSETLAIWVSGATTFEFQDRMQVLEDAFDQLVWSVEFTIGDSKETWSIAEPAEYQITTQREFWIARTGYITAQVPRLPTVLREQIA